METVNLFMAFFSAVQNYAEGGMAIRETWSRLWAVNRDVIVAFCQKEQNHEAKVATYKELAARLGVKYQKDSRALKETISMMVGLSLPSAETAPCRDEEVVAAVLRLREEHVKTLKVYDVLTSLYGRPKGWEGAAAIECVDQRTVEYAYKAVQYRHQFVREVDRLVRLTAGTAVEARREAEAAVREAAALAKWEKAKAEAEKWGNPIPPKPERKPKETPVPNDTTVIMTACRQLEKASFNYTATPQAIARIRAIIDLIEARSLKPAMHIDSPTESVLTTADTTTVSA
jgi:hypothetical protein